MDKGNPNPASRAAQIAVIREAVSWAGTPYHHMGRVKGVGVDCACFPAEVYERAGIIAHVPVEYYSPEWHLHQREELYLNEVRKYATEVDAPMDGGLVLFRIGFTYSHGAIIIKWPRIIHAVLGRNVMEDDAEANSGLRDQKRLFFSPWGK